MNLPTQHQIVVVSAHIGTAATTVIATMGIMHLITPAQVADAGQAISQIGDGLGKVMAGLGTLGAIAISIYTFFTSGPFASLFRASAAIASDPAKLAQLQQGTAGATLDQKVALVTVTDRIPEVAGVGTTRTDDGKALAELVPSATVQSVVAMPKAAI